MRYGSSDLLVPVMTLAFCVGALAQTPTYNNVGRAPTAEETRAMGFSAGPSGKDLPPGSGTAKQGSEIYARKCAACHGRNLEGGQGGPRLVGGKGSITTPEPVRTIGSFWPFATPVWDAINRNMPVGQAGTLKPDEVYALTAFILYRNDIIQENDVLDANTLPKVQMPNKNGFIPPRLEDINRLRCRAGTCP